MRVTGTTVTLTASKLARAGLLEAAAKKVGEEVSSRIRDRARDHYLNLLDQVNRAVAAGPATIRSSGSKEFKFQHVGGRQGRLVTAPWAALSPAYAGRAPVSERYWAKRGRLVLYVSAATQSARGRPIRTKFQFANAKRKDLVTLRVTVSFTKLPEPLDSIVRRSFVSGAETRAPVLGGPNRNTLDLLVYVEGSLQGATSQPIRPFLARLAAQLGGEMRRSLRKVK